MEYFERFAWAVPWAFHDALNLCRFERGDTLYDTAEAYGLDWAHALEVMGASIQVRSPEQLTAPSVLDERSVFVANWSSELRLDLFHKLERVEADVITTQGRLYTALWHGDLTVLDLEVLAPDPPAGWKAVLQILPEAKEAIVARWRDGPVFVMPHDIVNPITQEKVAAVTRRLSARLVEGPVLLSPAEATLSTADDFAPTVYVAAFPVRGLTKAQLVEEIKAVLYHPDPAAKNPRFRLAAHGVLF